jgi:glycosyltransferase involved in cell wall biosynthesis/SAM-dependent methyltransferase
MAAAPLVSVITIFLNAERFIEEAIESVRAQTYDDWELLLVDDGSSDASTAIARRYAAAQPGRIRYLEHPRHANRGTGPSRDRGLEAARGHYVAFLDADDVWLPRRLERHVEVLESCPDVAMVYGPTLYWFDWPGAPVPKQRDYVSDLRLTPNRRYEPPHLLTRFLTSRGGAVPGIGSLTVRRAAALVAGFENRFRSTFEDQAFLSRICLHEPVYVTDECLDRYRQHADSCCARAIASGRYHPKRPNPDYHAYLTWLEEGLARGQVTDGQLLRALRWRLLPYRQPKLASMLYVGYRAKDLLRGRRHVLARSTKRHRRSAIAASSSRLAAGNACAHERRQASASMTWDARQEHMGRWYQDLLEARRAAEHLSGDYRPFEQLLASFHGRILDVGGGCGFARNFIKPCSEYISVDPSEGWLGPEWLSLSENVPGTLRARDAAFVRAVGESLPFPDDTFDGALAMWSLNHVCEPAMVFREIGRVLKPGARWLAVFEDMEPTWLDAARAVVVETMRIDRSLIQLEEPGRTIAKRKSIGLLRRRDWPLQGDHIRIREADISVWCAGRFRRAGRCWIGGFLAYELTKLPERASHG